MLTIYSSFEEYVDYSNHITFGEFILKDELYDDFIYEE